MDVQEKTVTDTVESFLLSPLMFCPLDGYGQKKSRLRGTLSNCKQRDKIQSQFEKSTPGAFSVPGWASKYPLRSKPNAPANNTAGKLRTDEL